MAFTELKDTKGSGERMSEYFPKKSNERKQGDYVIGVYQGSRIVKRPDGNEDKIFVLKGENGLIGINNSAVINTKFSQIAEGMKVKVQYEGKARGKSGHEYNNFSVWIDEDESSDEKEELDF